MVADDCYVFVEEFNALVSKIVLGVASDVAPVLEGLSFVFGD
jgi:hypothetical protein